MLSQVLQDFLGWVACLPDSPPSFSEVRFIEAADLASAERAAELLGGWIRWRRPKLSRIRLVSPGSSGSCFEGWS